MQPNDSDTPPTPTALITSLTNSPAYLALDLTNSRIYVADNFASTRGFRIINTATNAVTTLAQATQFAAIEFAQQAAAPTVTTAAATTVTSNGAVLGGEVTANGGATVTERGVVYSTTNQTPTTSDTKDTNGTGTGTFSETISGLTTGTTYYVRAYATNSVGTSYGSVVSFTTPPNAPVVVVLANGSIVNNTNPTYAGTAVANSTVTVIVDGTAIGTTTTTSAGNWALTQPAALAQGSHTVRATASINGSGQSASSNTNTFTVDSVRPTVVISSSAGASGSTTGTSPIPFNVTFSESMTGFAAGDVTVTNGTISSFAGSGAAYSFTVTPAAGGAITVNVPANVAQDAAGNFNTTATQFSITYTPPTATVVSVTRLTPSPTTTTQVSYRVVFSGSVTGVTTSNFNVTTTGGVTGASVSSVSGSGTTYTVTVNTGTGDGTLRLNVANSTGTTPTLSNVPYTAGEVYTITKSFAANPQLTIQGTGGTGSDVTAFVDVAQVLSGGSPFANGLQNSSFETHDILANGDYGYQPTGASWTFNAQAGIAEAGSLFTPITPVPNGIAVAFVQSNNGNNGQIQQNLAVPTGSNYQVSFQAAQRICCTTLDQTLNVFLNGVFLGSIQPNSNAYTTFTSATFAVTAPALTATVSTTSASPTGTAPIPFSVSFSQSVGSTFTASDVTVAGGTLTSGSFSGSGSGPYTFTVTPSASGTISVNLAANVALDANNTGNSASNTVSVQYAQPVTAAPVITSPANGSLTNQAVTISGTAPAGSAVTVYINQNNGAFQELDIYTATAGGTFTTPAFPFPSATYQIYATAQSPGAAVSANSNTNTFTVDITRPAVTISSTAGASSSSTSTSPIPFTVTFSENVTGFVAGDVTVTNGTITGGIVNGTSPGTTFTFNVTPTTAGTATTVSVPANVAQDAARNFNTAAPAYSLTLVAPTIVVAPATLPNGTVAAAYSQTLTASGGTAPYSFAISAGALPTGLTLSAGGTLAGTPTTSGTFNFTVRATDASAAPGPYNGARSYSLTISAQPVTAAPTVTAPANGSLTNNPFPVYAGTATAGSTVTVYVGPNAGTATAIGTTTATGSGNFTLTQPSALGNGMYKVYATAQLSGQAASVNSNTNVFTVDVTAPTVVISSTTGNSTSTSPIPFTVTFSESVTGFVQTDVTVTNGTISAFSGSGASYSFNVTPASSGSVTVNVPANVAQDAANNVNTAANPFTVIYSQPVTPAPVVIEPANGSLVNNNRPVYGGTAVAGSTVTVYVDGTSVGTATTATDGRFNLIQPAALAQGSHTVYVTAQLNGLSVSANSNTNTFIVDTFPPTVLVSASGFGSGGNTSSSPILFAVSFSESVTGFVAGDVTITNGTISDFVGSGSGYTFNVTPTAAGTVTVNVPTNVAQDAAGNGNIAASPFSFTYNQAVTAAPVVIMPANGSRVATTTPTYEGTAPAGSVVRLYVDGTALPNTVTANSAGNWAITQPTGLPQGSHTVYATAQLSGQAVSANSSTNTFIVDSVRPTVVISSSASNPTSTSPIPVTVTFSESVTGFVAGDVTVGNGTISGFSGSGTSYSLNVTPASNGTVTVNVPANVAQDAAANFNTAATQFSINYQQTVTAAPMVIVPTNGSLVSTTTPTYGGTAPVNSTVTVYVDGLSIGTTIATGSGNWTITQPAALAQGSHTVYATAQSSGAVVSANSLTNTFTVDSVQPTVAFSSTATSPTSTSPIPVTVTFSESVTGFSATDVTVRNGTLANFSGSGASYSFTITPAANGQVTANIAANVAQDAAGNPNAAAPQFLIFYNQAVTPAPVVIAPANGSLISTTTPTYSGTAVANSTVTVYVDGAAIGTTTATSAGNFTLTQPSALAQGSHTVYATAQVSGSAASANSSTNTFSVDSTSPTVAISSTATNPTSTTPIPVTVTFSESVTGFSAGDVTVSNGTLTGFSGSGSAYSFSVTPTANGQVTVNIAANVAQDVAGNGNSAATPFSVEYSALVVATSWTGAVSTDWFTAGNWTSGVPTSTVDATVANGAPRYPVVATGTANTKNLTVASNASLTQSGGIIALTGNFATAGTFTATGGQVSLVGTSEQRLGGVRTAFWDLTVGASGARLDGPVDVQRVLTLNGNLNTNSQPMTLLSNSTATAMVVNSGGVVNGIATVQRYIDPSINPGTGYRHYSSPVVSTTVADLATSGFLPVVNPDYNTVGNTVNPFPTVYGYNEARITGSAPTAQEFEYGYFSPENLSAGLLRGRGYTVHINGDQKVDLVGTLNTGTIPVGSLTRGAEVNSGWHLLGNPYPAPLDWKKARLGLPDGISDAIYVYKSSSLYTGTYQFYQNGFGNLPGGIVSSMQGFFIRVNQTVPAFNFQDTWRSTSYEAPVFNRPAADNRPALQLDLVSAAGPHDPAYVYFEEGATAGLDDHYDAEKLPNPTGLNLASVAVGKGLAVNGLPVLQATTIVPLTVGVPVTGSYTLQAASLANFGSTSVYLLDAETGQQVDLKQQSTYRFSASNAALITGRFSLSFGALRPLATNSSALASSVALYPNPAQKMAWVELPTALGRKPVTAALLDALGRVVRTQQLPANGDKAHALSLDELPVGVYSLRLSTEAGMVTKRLIIK
ncbi:Ig-like domain-containing protein [Hymenobacter cellulosilyticus]|uniref:Ig-like domain-containing protein n=1 Tax=Hymenobacter cellulosilyticus TaxID=2932248 RepID=A0A8T9QD46_9BACT|nr:Ig-like domain-containing protein [Hymenobacter cellulosilyticus]UOQ72763.1 Ig-like domain-containing protein [Hymenobacter cellulosilyticus]